MKIHKATFEFCVQYLKQIDDTPLIDLDLSEFNINLPKERVKELLCTGLSNVNLLNSNLVY